MRGTVPNVYSEAPKGERRLLLRCREHTSEGVIGWAKSKDWWPRVARERPYSDARWWIWILREEGT
jgi:hypothetical protein